MKRLLLVFCLMYGVSWSAQSTITDWLETYYVTKDDSRLDDFWLRTVARGALKQGPQMRERLIAFFGPAFRTHPDLLRRRITKIPEEKGVEQDGITIILWLSDSDYSKRLLRESGFEKIAETPVSGIGNRRILYTDDVDFLYGWYCATGDTAALQLLFDYVVAADWTLPDQKPGYAAAMIQYFCERDLRAWTFVDSALRSHPVEGELRKLFDAVLKSKPANQSLEPTATAVTDRADARSAPASAVAQH